MCQEDLDVESLQGLEKRVFVLAQTYSEDISRVGNVLNITDSPIRGQERQLV